MNAKRKERFIEIKGACLHNLKSVDVRIKHGAFIVVTGLSGSGKSSLILDTLYAEGQRRYVESLSAYARQFLGKIEKPPVAYIKGIAPAIAIEQKNHSNNPRSTVGTQTELYDYLRLLFAHIGKTYHPITGNRAMVHHTKDVINTLKGFTEKTKVLLLAPIFHRESIPITSLIESFLTRGYARIFINGATYQLNEEAWQNFTAARLKKFAQKEQLFLVVDRWVIHSKTAFEELTSSIETAFTEGRGKLRLHFVNDQKEIDFSNQLSVDGLVFEKPTPHLFGFNNPLGACPTCEGYGDLLGIDPALVIPNTNLSIYEGAIAPWRSERFHKYRSKLIFGAEKHGIPIHTPWHEIADDKRTLIWNGTKDFKGINYFFEQITAKSYKISSRILLSRFRGRTHCPDCKGSRLKSESLYVKVGDKNIADLVVMSIDDLKKFFDQLILTDEEQVIVKRVLYEINTRLKLLQKVGLGYLTINRKSNSLSGGEHQRIRLTTSLATNLVGAMYILDEPSVGLHPKDTDNLIAVLKKLQALGNTVIVVEHDAQIMRAADEIIDMGPGAGSQGGTIIAQGDHQKMIKSGSITAAYLKGDKRVERKIFPKHHHQKITLKGARANNLKNIDVVFPLKQLVAVTGVSGSGKSSLVRDILYPAVRTWLESYTSKAPFTSIEGDFYCMDSVLFIDQNPLGRSSRSNVVTYLKAYDDIRALFAHQKAAKMANLTSRHFSFNVDAGRCEHCKGDGYITVPMQFMADVTIVCEHCRGKRFQTAVLAVAFHGKNIYDILSYSVDDAVTFFKKHGCEKIAQQLYPLQAVGLGYVSLGQASATFSTGEAQRLKLASFLTSSTTKEKVLFLFDEPTTGLHFQDVQKLLGAFEALLERGHSIIFIEHHTDLIRCADHVIELGPQAGVAGGQVIFEGTPEQLKNNSDSMTGKYL